MTSGTEQKVWKERYKNLSETTALTGKGPGGQPMSSTLAKFKDIKKGGTRAEAIASMPQSAVMGRLDPGVKMTAGYLRTDKQLAKRKAQAEKKFGAGGFEKLQASEINRVANWKAAIFDQLSQGMTGEESMVLGKHTGGYDRTARGLMGVRTGEEQAALRTELGRKMTMQEKDMTSGGVVQVGTRLEMETMLQGLQAQLKTAGDQFLDADTIKRLQGRLSDIGEQQQVAFKTPGATLADSKHIINMKAYAQALTAINQAVKTEQIASVITPLNDVMVEFRALAPELARLKPQVLKDMAMALTQGEGVEGVRERAEASGITSDMVGGWENFEKKVMEWQQSYNLSEPDQFTQSIELSTRALKPYTDAVIAATTALTDIKTDIKEAEKAAGAARAERAASHPPCRGGMCEALGVRRGGCNASCHSWRVRSPKHCALTALHLTASH